MVLVTNGGNNLFLTHRPQRSPNCRNGPRFYQFVPGPGKLSCISCWSRNVDSPEILMLLTRQQCAMQLILDLLEFKTPPKQLSMHACNCKHTVH